MAKQKTLDELRKSSNMLFQYAEIVNNTEYEIVGANVRIVDFWHDFSMSRVVMVNGETVSITVIG